MVHRGDGLYDLECGELTQTGRAGRGRRCRTRVNWRGFPGPRAKTSGRGHHRDCRRPGPTRSRSRARPGRPRARPVSGRIGTAMHRHPDGGHRLGSPGTAMAAPTSTLDGHARLRRQQRLVDLFADRRVDLYIEHQRFEIFVVQVCHEVGHRANSHGGVGDSRRKAVWPVRVDSSSRVPRPYVEPYVEFWEQNPMGGSRARYSSIPCSARRLPRRLS